MRECKLYPNTQRIKNSGTPYLVTEKLDRKNISIYKLDGKLFVGLRNNVFTLDEMVDKDNKSTSEFRDWFEKHGLDLQEKLYEGSCIHGEWLKRGIYIRDYKKAGFDKGIYLFAKSRISKDGTSIEKLNYHLDELKYPFDGAEIPEYIGLVPKVSDIWVVPTKEVLDELYEKYTDGLDRRVEGFVVSRNNTIEKYLRYEGGKPVEYDENSHKSKKQ